jgi:hypothetical protein
MPATTVEKTNGLKAKEKRGRIKTKKPRVRQYFFALLLVEHGKYTEEYLAEN